MWLEELEEGIRKQDAFTVYRYARLLAGTGTGSKHRRFGQIRACTPSQIEWAQGLAKEGPKGGLALHEHTWNDFRREHLESQDLGDSATTTLHREEARADYARTVKQLRRAPARRSCPPWSIPGRLWMRKGTRRFDALGYKPPAGSQLLETRHDITSCLDATRRCDAAPSRSLGWVVPKPGKLGFESCRLVLGMCDFWKAWHRGLFLEGTWPDLPSCCYGFQRARRREGAVASHLALAARCRHEIISFVDERLDMADAFGSLDRKKTRKTRFNQDCERLTDSSSSHGDGDVSQKCWLQTELRVVLRKWVCSLGDKNAPDVFGAVVQGAIDTWQASVTKKNGGIFGRSPYEDVERSCGVTLFADDVFREKCAGVGHSGRM